MGFGETRDDQHPEQSLPDRVGLAGYSGFALMLAGLVCGGASGLALAALGTITIVLSGLFVAYLYATKHPAAQRES
jgi:4-amino-4-deoxy-L-arabinose transferase-like glycosyltransferase